MEYFKKYPDFSVFKNHILKDPILDWYEINHEKYDKDDESGYKKFISHHSDNYKLELLKKIRDLSGLDIPLKTSFGLTKKLIYDKSPLILQGILMHKDDYYVDCDIIIRYDLFRKIFPKINNLPFHILCKDKDYLLINTSYSTLHFKVDLKDVSNEGVLFYKKCKLFSFREVFYELTDNISHCFILGKDYYYKKTLLPNDEFIAKVNINENLSNSIDKAKEWIYTLKNEINKMDLLPEPTHPELYPNMNNKESDWENEKIKLAEKIKEITLIWNISYDERCDFLKKNIKKWDDPKLLKELKESKKKNIQERMIHMNQQKEILLYPRKNISYGFQKILNNVDENNIYFDVESFLSFDEKKDPSFQQKNDNPILGILGYIYNDVFYNHTIDKFSKNDEKRIVKAFSDHLNKISKNKKPINIYHWGHAENRYMDYIHDEFSMISFPSYNLINVLDHFRLEPIIVQGIFKFGLKTVGKALYENNLINTTWGDNDNGLDSMILFKEICMKNTQNIPLKRFLDIKEIIDYNETDCKVLYEIVELLRNKYKNY